MPLRLIHFMPVATLGHIRGRDPQASEASAVGGVERSETAMKCAALTADHRPDILRKFFVFAVDETAFLAA